MDWTSAGASASSAAKAVMATSGAAAGCGKREKTSVCRRRRKQLHDSMA